MSDTLRTLLILCPMVFLAGFIDSIAGGGGLISLPAYLLCGFPAHIALGSNKMSSAVGTFIATCRYWRNGAVDIKVGLSAGLLALVGSAAGARLAIAVSDRFLRTMLLILLPVVAAIILLSKRGGEIDHSGSLSARRSIVIASMIGLGIGAYDGFFGPGTGTFLILAFTGLLRFDYTKASGTAKVVNLSSNIAALAMFVLSSNVAFWAAIPAAACSVAGNWIGSGMAIRRGARFIRLILVVVLALLFVRLLYDFVAS